jgi:hypothetical protein
MVQAVKLPSNGLRLGPGQSHTYSRTGQLEWVKEGRDFRLQLTLFGGTPSTYTTTEPLTPGEYTLTLTFKSVHKMPGDAGAWDVTTRPVKVVLSGEAVPALGGEGVTKVIGLGVVFGTTGQKEIKPVSAGFRPRPGGGKEYLEPYGPDLARLVREHRGGASSVFLVRGKDLTEAVRATWEIQTAGARADVPVTAGRQPSKAPHWLVIYFGVSGSSPPQWLVRSVEVRGKTIRVSYNRGKAETNDEHPYYLWVPLGQLAAGNYTLELFDADAWEVTLMRRCTAVELKGGP